MTRAERNRIMRDDVKRRNAQIVADATQIVQHHNARDEIMIENPSAPGWRTPEIHSVPLMPVPKRGAYVAVRRNFSKPRTTGPAFAGSGDFIAAQIANRRNPAELKNHVRVINPDGSESIKRFGNNTNTRTTSTRTTRTTSTTNENTHVNRLNEVARLAPSDLSLADGTA